MSYADRVKETTTATSTETIALAGAVDGYRAFADAPELPVGTKNIPVCIADSSSWEIGLYTLTDAATLTRTAILSSSNNNEAITFGAGGKDVFCVMPAETLRAGLTNADDAGFDIVLCAGQSNMEGNPDWDEVIDIGDSRMYQFGGSSADSATYRKIISGVDPLYMYNGVRTGKTGPATWFGKAYLSTIPSNRRLILVPVAAGSTALVGSTWESGNPGGTLYELAITQSNLAITAAQAWFPSSRFVGVIWAQGEADGLTGTTQAQYANGLKAVIAGFRSRITGAADSWFVIEAMTPEGMVAHTGEVVIDLAHQQVADETDKCVYVAGVAGYASDVHYTAPGIRIMGSRLGLAVRNAIRHAGVVVAADAITLTGPTSGVVSVESSNFTVGVSPVGGAITETLTVTPGDASGGGTFSPTSLSLSTGSPSGTFTYTPSSTGAKTISVTNDGGLTDPSSITYTASAAATAPDAPTIGAATAGDASASVTFTAPASDGGSAITSYTVTSTPDGITATGTSSPINVTGLTNDTAYTFTAHATNAVGDSAESGASNSITPAAAVEATYTTFNPSDAATGITLSNGNLTAAGTAGFKSVRAIAGKTSGKWYCEYKMTAGTAAILGFARSTALLTNFAGSDANGWGYYSTGKSYYSNTIVDASLATYAIGDVIGMALDMDTKTGQFYKNGVAQGAAFVLKTSAGGSAIDDSVAIYPMASPNGATVEANFGATAFAYTPPVGYTGLTA